MPVKFHEILCSGLTGSELRWQIVHCYIQNKMAKILSSKGPKFPEEYWNRNFLVASTTLHIGS